VTGRESEGSGSSGVEVGTGKDAGKLRTGVRTGAGIGNCRDTEKWDFAVNIVISQR
jgi:hypothetical protein